MFAMHHAVSFVLLTVLSLTYSSALRRVERLRRVVSNDWLPDMNGCWTFASVMLLPPPWIAAAVSVFYLAEWPSRRAVGDGRPGKYAYSCAASITAAVVAREALHGVGGLLGIAAAIATFAIANIGLVSLAIIASRQFGLLKMLKNPHAHRVELTTRLIGAALGGAIAWHEALAIFVLPVLWSLHLVSTRKAVSDTRSFDEATRLWNEKAWTFQASELIDDGKMVTVFVVDGDSDRAVLADVMRPCLTRTAVFGSYGPTQMAVICGTGSLNGAAVIVRRVADALERSGAGFSMGTRTARTEDLSEMLAHALSDLMAARCRTGVTNPW